MRYETYRVLLILKSDGVFGSRSRKMNNEPLGGLVEALGAFQGDRLYQGTLQQRCCLQRECSDG